jgi:dihydrofolate synthase/folylpolyglutamate synthase
VQDFYDYLDSKPLYYKEIDYQRIHRAYAILKPHIHQPTTMHLVGTNGKGSTGRTLAHLIHKGTTHSVMHYSSPHILHFNERIWINGANCSDTLLQESHQKLFALLGKETSDGLTYFEYTTLLAFVVGERCDYMILEAGLGGEYDATNVVSKELSVITPIGLDHQEFLGDTLQAIATTKMNSIESHFVLAIGNSKEVEEIAKKIAKQKGVTLFKARELLSKTQIEEIHALGFHGYLADNIMTAVGTLNLAGIEFKINDLATLQLFGRFYRLTPNITIDVGHNPLSATQIAKNLGEKKVVLIYNTLQDKAYQEILGILSHNIQRVEIMPLDGVERALDTQLLSQYLEDINIKYQTFKKINHDEEYLVYGSFYTVESFLKYYENR